MTTAQTTPGSSQNRRRGVMLVISSPSGAGKSALSRLLMQEEKDIHLSISVTTRLRRPSEVDGVHYRFISVEDFHTLRQRGDLLEWAQVHGNFYATPRLPVEQALDAGRDVLFDIDVQGTLQLYSSMRADVVSVFILPPSIAELERRLKRRAEDAADVIRRRLTTAKGEISHWQDYDYVLVNEDLERCFKALRGILDAERLKRARNPVLEARIRELQADLAMLLKEAPVASGSRTE